LKSETSKRQPFGFTLTSQSAALRSQISILQFQPSVLDSQFSNLESEIASLRALAVRWQFVRQIKKAARASGPPFFTLDLILVEWWND
jgi:hypothetical protein